MEHLVRESGLSGRVFLPGKLKNIAETMEKNSLFVLSSDFEGMQNPLMKTMALGLPCISTDCPRFLINDVENGVLVPVGDADAMAQAIHETTEDKQRAFNIEKKRKK